MPMPMPIPMPKDTTIQNLTEIRDCYTSDLVENQIPLPCQLITDVSKYKTYSMYIGKSIVQLMHIKIFDTHYILS